VNCPSCGYENPTIAKFCQGCGGRFRTACSGCGTELPPRARFCHECGQRTASEATPPEKAAPAPSAPRRLADGRYELRRFIGEGAKKRVHLAYDSRLDREVALALIKTDGLDDAGRVRVRREAQAMGSLGDHPNIVTVHDIGEDGDQLFIVSQYMSGGDLESALQDAGEQRRLEPGEALRIAIQLCHALEHAHSRGVVHRDLKPGNVWLAADGSARLGDFGLAVSADRTRLTQEGMMVGTVAYMAPEQALGRGPDARSDLYALGATLYEMLTGRPPFLGDDAVAIISQHIHTPPVAPSWHNPEIPPRLETLVLELLEKDPERRPASASVLAEQLEQVSSGSAEPTPAGEPATVNPLDRLAGGVFVGREDQLEQLRRGVDDALSGRGSVLLLVGEPGIGKTRTSDELATYARLRGAQVLWGSCYEGEGAPAYWPWMQIIRAYVHEREPQLLLSEMGPGAADIAEIVSEVRERLPGLPAPPKLEPEQARFRLFDSITSFLKNASQREPIVLVLDDLHWADRPSLLLLQFLARDVDASRILLLGTYRDVEVGRQHPLEQTLGELARTQTGERVLLRGLSDDDVARFIELTSGHTAPRALVEAVYRETEGNPFFVHEVVRLLQSDGRLEHPESVASWSLEIPQGVRQVVGRRLDGLPEECNRVLAVASIIGRDFELRVLAEAAQLEEEALLELLEQAEDARILTEADGAPGAYRFSHALVRETLYDEVRTTRRVRLHRRIAEVLEQRHAGRIEPHLDALAYHYCEAASGGDVEKAVDYATRAARRALEGLGFEEAANHFDRALTALEAAEAADETLRCELMLQKGDAYFRAGVPEARDRSFLEAADLARALGSPLHLAMAVVGRLDAWIAPTAREPELLRLLDEAIAELGDDYPALRGRLLARRAGRLAWTVAPDAAEAAKAAAREAVRLVESTENLDARREANHVYERLVVGPRGAAESLARGLELAELASRIGDRGVEHGVRHVCVLHAHLLGDFETADREAAICRQLAEELRQPMPWALVEQCAAQRALRLGRLAEARHHAWQGRTQILRVWEPVASQTFGAQLYHLRRLQGRVAETLETLRAGVEAQPGAPIWRGLLACAYAESGEVDAARRELELARRDDYAALRQNPLNGPETYALLSEACVAAEHGDAAAELYEILLPLVGLQLQLTSLIPLGAAARYLGNLTLLLGRPEAAEEHLQQAIAFETRTGSLGWLPRAQCDYARMLLVRSASGDREKALGLLDAAMKTCQELGLKGWLDLCIETKLAAQGVDSGTTTAKGTIDAVVSSIGSRAHDFRQGFTAMTERLGDLRAREVIREHNAIVREQLRAEGGHEVEMQGDAFLLAFPSPPRAFACAIAIQRRLAERNANAEVPIRIRIGLHTGEVLRDAERFFGLSVILAARIAGQADGGEILVSSLLAERLQSVGDVRFGAARQVDLKGISERNTLHRAEWE
jgi:serine/threonine protein kinase/tetratricopeptide (TPR) repeat protein